MRPTILGVALAAVCVLSAAAVRQLAALARQAKPRLLILYHYNSLSPEELQADMMKHYSGRFVIGRDLDVY